MQIVLPTEIKTFVEREVASGRYADEQHVIVEALRRLADEEPDDRVTVAEAIANSLAQMERGEVVPFTEDFMRESAARARENSRKGHKVSDDVKY
jgi:putative addiction module CopG family antidote